MVIHLDLDSLKFGTSHWDSILKTSTPNSQKMRPGSRSILYFIEVISLQLFTATRLTRGNVLRLTSGHFYMLPHRDKAVRP